MSTPFSRRSERRRLQRRIVAVLVAALVQLAAVGALVAAWLVALLAAWSGLGEGSESAWPWLGVIVLGCAAPALWVASGWIAARLARDRRMWWTLAIGPAVTMVVVVALQLP